MSDQFSPTEEKINAVAAGSGFRYGGHVTDGTTLWFRGNSERLSFNPKTGNVSYLRNGKVESECPVDQLKHIASAEDFHRALKKQLGQDKTGAIRPSPHAVFENKVDNATGKQPEAPPEPSDDEVMQAQKTLENAGVGDQIGVNAAEESEATLPDDWPEGWHLYDPKTGEEIKKKSAPKEAAVTKTYGTGTPPGGTPNDPSVDIEDDEDDKTAAAKTALVGIHETPKFLPPRDDVRRHLDEQVQDEVMEGVMDGVKDDKTAASDDQANEFYLDKVDSMKAEAKDAFMLDAAMQQEAQDAGMSMDELWDEVGGAFTENYYISAYSKQGSIEVYEGLKCPNCKSTKGKPVEDGTDGGVSLQECLTCGSFY